MVKTGERMSVAEARRQGLIPGGAAGVPATPPASRNRSRATKVVIDGIRFDSKLEAAYYLYLKHLQETRAITGFLRQQSIRLPGGTVYRPDFLVFSERSKRPGAADTPKGWYEFIDVKGYETETFRIKRNEIHATYPWIFIRCVTKDEIDSCWKKRVNEELELAAAMGGN